jgi:cytidylate kinase
VERLASALAVASPEILPPPTEQLPPSEERLAAVTRRIIEEAVARGNAILVGRGAQSVLARRAGVLHVFCYAPREALVRRVAERRGVSVAEAEKIVEEINKQREQYVRTTFKRSWKAHENYHVCVNTEWLGVEGAAQAIVSAARQMGLIAPSG